MGKGKGMKRHWKETLERHSSVESLFEDEEDQDQPRPQALESSCSEETSKVCYLVYLQNLFAVSRPFIGLQLH